MNTRFEPGIMPPSASDEPAFWFAFHKAELLIAGDAGLPQCRDLAELGLSSVRRIYLGTFAGRHCYVSELAHADTIPDGHALQGLRAVLGGPETMYPEFRARIKDSFNRPEKCVRNCGGPPR